MTQEDLGPLTREMLIELLLKQADQITALEANQARLQQENEILRQKLEQQRKPPTNSHNSSQPPSRDQKSNRSDSKPRHRHGPPKGHAGHERKFVAHPDQVVEVKAKVCTHCQSSLETQAGELSAINQITELPCTPAQVIEVHQYRLTCPDCHEIMVAEPPEGLEMTRRFGSRLEATVVYCRQEQHMSYERTQQLLENLYGVTISQGGIDLIMQRSGLQALKAVEPIQAQIRASAVIYSDETTARVEGNTWWEWVFCTAQAILHVIRFNRSSDVIQDVMGPAQADIWVSDCLLAQLKSPTRARQLCLAHQIRNLQAVIDRSPPAIWATTLQTLFRYAIHLHNRRERLATEEFQAKVAWLERCLTVLIDQPLLEPEARLLKKRYREHRHHLLVFLHRTDVEPTNNISERALRSSVIHRKVLSGFRSDWGAQAYAALASVIDTAELKGVHAFAAIQSLFGPSALSLPYRA